MNEKKLVDVDVLGAALAKLCNSRVAAGLLDSLLGCDANARLSDGEVAAAESLYDVLVGLRSDAVKSARRG